MVMTCHQCTLKFQLFQHLLHLGSGVIDIHRFFEQGIRLNKPYYFI
jgi:hypothetical protein